MLQREQNLRTRSCWRRKAIYLLQVPRCGCPKVERESASQVRFPLAPSPCLEGFLEATTLPPHAGEQYCALGAAKGGRRLRPAFLSHAHCSRRRVKRFSLTKP